MAEEATVVAPEETPVQTPEAPSPFAQTAWTTELPQVQTPAPAEATPTQAPTPTPAPAAVTPPAEEEEIIDPNEWLKRELEVDDVAILKAEREELKQLRERKLEIKYENEFSEKLHKAIEAGKIKEVTKMLKEQEALEEFTSKEVNKDTAGDIIKMGMSLKYKDLSPSEIEYKYNKEFGLPKKPVERDDLSEDENAARIAEWEEKVRDIEMNKIIEAKLAKPELEKAKANVVLPDLTPKAPNAPSPESLAAQEEEIRVQRQNFLNKLESDYAKFDGYTTKVKDESVEIPVSFKAPDEVKAAIKERFKAGFDINGFLDARWSDENGNQKIEQIISDIYQLENLDKILSGVANNAANQRMADYIKSLKNPSIGSTPQQTYQQSNGNSNVSPFAKGAWSEKPPVLNN